MREAVFHKQVHEFPSCFNCGPWPFAGILPNMPLLQKHIENLKQIHKQTTGETLSDAEAWDMANRLITFGSILRTYEEQYPRGDIRPQIK